jgi:RNA polymerase sigma-70 factor (ECF subfamily)
VAWRRRSVLPEDALPWLYGVARRALAEQRRGTARRRRLGERLRRDAVEATPAPALPDEGLAAALRQLSQGDREALLLRYWEELEPAQIAQVMGCSRPAMAVRLHRARLRLRRQLEAVSDQPQEDQQHEDSCVTGTEPI